MNKAFIAKSLCMCITFASGFLPASSLQAAPIRSPKAITILKRARSAAANLTSISYEATLIGEGPAAKRKPIIDGTVLAKRGPKYSRHKLLIKGTKTTLHSVVTDFLYACDGTQAYVVNDQAQEYISGGAEGAYSEERDALFPKYYMESSAYDIALNAVAITYLGIQKISGVECSVVNVQFDKQGQRITKLYFGTRDFILRRSEESIGRFLRGRIASPDSFLLFTINNMKANIEIDEKVFHVNPPNGYHERKFRSTLKPVVNRPGTNRRPPRSADLRLLRLGSKAPDWSLLNANGKQVSLKSLRGKVVLLDFWATWCGPCRKAMPEIQKMHERYKGKPVAIYGVNCYERSYRVDPAKFIKSKGYTYPQLLGGTRVASIYHARSIPTFYVIGKDGKILYAGSGFSSHIENAIKTIIDRALK